ncbi:unnamed protein product [Acanthoscelides obtectus]|uniref:C2H2-type domain-containing protein n=1 Tax=Acanthoscelides obtectus TaxID=200917 RepID=A0A9P0LCP0_ACAOB|nr:unnamed protein product [Acanthoscelides obtectus]CAK1630826.1 Zinc finger Y-chromosomal protein [Acanthoscelides obtectus]
MASTCNYCRLHFENDEFRDKHHMQCGPQLSIKIHLDKAIERQLSAKLKELTDENTSKKDALKDAKEKKKHHCSECPYKTDRRNCLDIHRLRHSKEGAKIFVCTTCKFQSYLEKSYTRHLNIHNKNSKKIYCHLCDYKASRKDLLNQHMLCHDRSNKKMYSCNICDYKSVYKSGIRSHSLVHEKSHRPHYICYYCNFKTHDKGTLKKHIQRHLKRLTPFKCPSCMNEYSLKTSRDEHILRIHPNLSHLVTSKVHNCSVCSYKTTQTGGLRSHQMKHSKENAEIFKCKICDYSSYRKGGFKLHMRIHDNIKKFICVKCKKKFIQDSHLANHILANHGKDKKLVSTIARKIYTCEFCKYRAINKNRMVEHYNGLHNKKFT